MYISRLSYFRLYILIVIINHFVLNQQKKMPCFLNVNNLPKILPCQYIAINNIELIITRYDT